MPESAVVDHPHLVEAAQPTRKRRKHAVYEGVRGVVGIDRVGLISDVEIVAVRVEDDRLPASVGCERGVGVIEGARLTEGEVEVTVKRYALLEVLSDKGGGACLNCCALKARSQRQVAGNAS